MTILENISLKNLNSFGLDVKARYFAKVRSIDDLISIYSRQDFENIFILGGGSNMLLTKDLDALVLHIDLKGISVIDKDENWVWVKAAAGENWHEFVEYCLKNDFGGLENLSLIPGNVGTAPIQNIGAYGVELKDVMTSCEAFDIENKQLITFNNGDCKFEYRNSIFKHSHKGKYIITSVTFKLSRRDHRINTKYGAIENELASRNIHQPTIQDVSQAVIDIRRSKLPDPAKIGNSGSFFKNPVISSTHFEKLIKQFKNIPSYPLDNGEVKVPAGWLIETAGFKGKRFGNYGVHQNQALVLVNYGGAKGADIKNLARLIQHTVDRIFDIKLEPEVNII